MSPTRRKSRAYPRLNPQGLPYDHVTLEHIVLWLSKLEARGLLWQMDDHPATVGCVRDCVYGAQWGAYWVPTFTPAQARMAEYDRQLALARLDRAGPGSYSREFSEAVDIHALCLMVLNGRDEEVSPCA